MHFSNLFNISSLTIKELLIKYFYIISLYIPKIHKIPINILN